MVGQGVVVGADAKDRAGRQQVRSLEAVELRAELFGGGDQELMDLV